MTDTYLASMTLSDAAEAMKPPIPRRELARRLKDVPAVGAKYGRRGRRAATFPIDAIMQAHAAWVRERGGRHRAAPGRVLADDQGVCQNSAQEECV